MIHKNEYEWHKGLDPFDNIKYDLIYNFKTLTTVGQTLRYNSIYWIDTNSGIIEKTYEKAMETALKFLNIDKKIPIWESFNYPPP